MISPNNPRILIISPKHSDSNLLWNLEYLRRLYSQIYNRDINSSSYPLALPLIHALIERELSECSIRVVDEDVEDLDFEGEWDLFCISANTLQITRAFDLCMRLSDKGKIILGGPHFGQYTELTYHEALKYADSVVFGKSDNLWKEILNDFCRNKLKRRYIGSSDIDEFALKIVPRFDTLKLGSYLHRIIETSRGCSRNCEFCCVSNKMRFKDVEIVVEEIKALRQAERQKAAPFGSIFFADNLMNPKGIHYQRCISLMESLIKYKESKYGSSG